VADGDSRPKAPDMEVHRAVDIGLSGHGRGESGGIGDLRCLIQSSESLSPWELA
jgi:hypothetical protein